MYGGEYVSKIPTGREVSDGGLRGVLLFPKLSKSFLRKPSNTRASNVNYLTGNKEVIESKEYLALRCAIAGQSTSKLSNVD